MDADIAAVGAGQVAGDGQAQAHAVFDAPALAAAIEGLEDLLLLVGGDAGAGARRGTGWPCRSRIYVAANGGSLRRLPSKRAGKGILLNELCY